MTTKEKECNERVNKILYGLEMTYEKLLAEKKASNRELIVLNDNKIVTIKP
jgi:sulfur carrier protein ThiS